MKKVILASVLASSLLLVSCGGEEAMESNMNATAKTNSSYSYEDTMNVNMNTSLRSNLNTNIQTSTGTNMDEEDMSMYFQ